MYWLSMLLHAKYSENKIIDSALRISSLILALIILFHPNPTYTLATLAPVAILVA